MRIVFLATALLMAASFTVTHFNDYATYRDYNVVMVEKMQTMGKCSRLVGLFKTETGETFETKISMSTYFSLNPGDAAVLSMRPMDIRQTVKQNIVWVLLPVCLYSVTLVACGLLIGLVFHALVSALVNRGYI